MNIIYLTFLDGKPWIGPTYSVPCQINAQSKFDSVVWFNLCDYDMPEGMANVEKWQSLPYYHSIKKQSPTLSFLLSQVGFIPDLIIVEQCYPFIKSGITKQLIKSGIPYIIIPRGEFTKTAQRKKRFKKIIGNFLFGVKHFTRKALAIQMLTKQESLETGLKWNKNHIILPNGVDIKQNRGEQLTANKAEFRFVYIGRYEPFQKGLDILFKAIFYAKDILISNNIHFYLYGSDYECKKQYLMQLCKDYNIDSIVIFNDAVFGNNKAEILNEADLFVMPSRFEGHPTGLLEALSYGIPCLVTTGSNMREEIESFDAGWGSDGNAKSLETALLEISSNLDKIPSKGKNAINLASLYGWDKIAEKSHKVYSNLLIKTKHLK